MPKYLRPMPLGTRSVIISIGNFSPQRVIESPILIMH
jgi:hypothetical protein